MHAINTTVPTAVAVMLLRVHWFVADHTRRTCVRAKLNHTCSVRGRWVREHLSPGYRDTKATILSLVRFTAWLHEVRTSV